MAKLLITIHLGNEYIGNHYTLFSCVFENIYDKKLEVILIPRPKTRPTE